MSSELTGVVYLNYAQFFGLKIGLKFHGDGTKVPPAFDCHITVAARF